MWCLGKCYACRAEPSPLRDQCKNRLRIAAFDNTAAIHLACPQKPIVQEGSNGLNAYQKQRSQEGAAGGVLGVDISQPSPSNTSDAVARVGPVPAGEALPKVIEPLQQQQGQPEGKAEQQQEQQPLDDIQQQQQQRLQAAAPQPAGSPVRWPTPAPSSPLGPQPNDVAVAPGGLPANQTSKGSPTKAAPVPAPLPAATLRGNAGVQVLRGPRANKLRERRGGVSASFTELQGQLTTTVQALSIVSTRVRGAMGWNGSMLHGDALHSDRGGCMGGRAAWQGGRVAGWRSRLCSGLGSCGRAIRWWCQDM